ncbi:class C sortase [Trueperella bialowiezensis]|uniref:Sortase (Surface protein transpeptidase) n=1 Tax=Trueperella bialowiezensis TaxID=312285 RepID=A0A3S4V820_9ACTO|nr:class C sortase [Trueperella bialowiezensis]VEI14018.1 Sortase (surface protein transpeptidase) [Trueperella bialowiezensis]
MNTTPIRRAWKPSPTLVIGVVFAFVGLLLGTYPFASSWLNEVNQSHAASRYVEEVSDDSLQKSELAKAEQYNKALNMGVDLLSNERIPTSSGQLADNDLDYYSILSSSPSKIMSRLRIETIGVDLPIYHGTDDDTLLKGAGHLEGSSLPVGGENTHSVITAHRGLANATMFDNLPKLEVGDTFTLETFGRILTYKVTKISTVEPEDTESLRVDSGHDLVTLVTCTPLGVNTHRVLVTGERIWPTPAADLARAGEPTHPGFPMWAVVFVLGTVGLGVLLWKLGYEKPRSESETYANKPAKDQADRPARHRADAC